MSQINQTHTNKNIDSKCSPRTKTLKPQQQFWISFFDNKM